MEVSWLLDADMTALKINRCFCFIRKWSQLPPPKFLMLEENQTKSMEQISEEWEESYVSFNLGTIRSPSQLWHVHLPLLLWAFRTGKSHFPLCLNSTVCSGQFSRQLYASPARHSSWAWGQESGSLSRNLILIWTLWWVRELRWASSGKKGVWPKPL